MSKGYLVFAQNSDVDYLKQAVCLAASLKASGNLEPISVVTNDSLPQEYQHLFDTVIPIPWGDSSKGSVWKVENRWKLYHVSPYDETIVLDSDVLVTDSLHNAWKFFSDYDLYFTSSVANFKAEKIVDTANRKTFIENKLPNVYFGFHYFKKSDLAYEFYKQLESVVKNYKHYYAIFTPKATQQFVSMDVSSAISLKILDIEPLVTCKVYEPIKFVHLKSNVQGLGIFAGSWMDILDCEVTDKLVIGNRVQRGIIHYVDENFLTDDIFERVLKW